MFACFERKENVSEIGKRRERELEREREMKMK